MSWFDDDDTPVTQEPSMLDDALDALDKAADKVAADFDADPVGYTASLLGAPKIDIDLDDGDGHMSVKVEGLLTSFKGDWDDAKGATVEGQAGMDWGAMPLLKGKAAVDADGDLQEVSTAAKLTIPVDGVLVSAEEASSFVRTEDGFKASMSTMAGANIEGIDLKAGTHVGYEDLGEHGYKANFGPDVSAGIGTGKVAPGLDIVEGELKSSTDFSFGEVDGQTTVGVQRTDTLAGKVFGQTVASVQSSEGVAYTTGPQGERLIFNESMEGTLGAGSAMATGKVGGTWEVGTDGQGNEVDRVTLSDSGKVTLPGMDPIAGGDSVTFENATGIHELLDDADTIEQVDSADFEPSEIEFPADSGEIVVDESPIETIAESSSEVFEFPTETVTMQEQEYQPEVIEFPGETVEEGPSAIGILEGADESFVEQSYVLEEPEYQPEVMDVIQEDNSYEARYGGSFEAQPVQSGDNADAAEIDFSEAEYTE